MIFPKGMKVLVKTLNLLDKTFKPLSKRLKAGSI